MQMLGGMHCAAHVLRLRQAAASPITSLCSTYHPAFARNFLERHLVELHFVRWRQLGGARCVAK
ncbi:MAG: hypothetical protein RL203_1555 [Pseudomonadota bacterium]